MTPYCTSDSSREVVTVSGTGLITAVAPGQAAVVLKMEQGGDSGVHIKTVLLTVSGEENPERPEPEGPTEEAVYAAITALKADYPRGNALDERQLLRLPGAALRRLRL